MRSINKVFGLAAVGFTLAGCAAGTTREGVRAPSSLPVKDWHYFQCEGSPFPDAARVSILRSEGPQAAIRATVNKKRDGSDHFRSRNREVAETESSGAFSYESAEGDLSVRIDPVVRTEGGEGFGSVISGSFVDEASGDRIAFRNMVTCVLQ